MKIADSQKSSDKKKKDDIFYDPVKFINDNISKNEINDYNNKNDTNNTKFNSTNINKFIAKENHFSIHFNK